MSGISPSPHLSRSRCLLRRSIPISKVNFRFFFSDILLFNPMATRNLCCWSCVETCWKRKYILIKCPVYLLNTGRAKFFEVRGGWDSSLCAQVSVYINIRIGGRRRDDIDKRLAVQMKRRRPLTRTSTSTPSPKIPNNASSTSPDDASMICAACAYASIPLDEEECFCRYWEL